MKDRSDGGDVNLPRGCRRRPCSFNSVSRSCLVQIDHNLGEISWCGHRKVEVLGYKPSSSNHSGAMYWPSAVAMSETRAIWRKIRTRFSFCLVGAGSSSLLKWSMMKLSLTRRSVGFFVVFVIVVPMECKKSRHLGIQPGSRYGNGVVSSRIGAEIPASC